MTYIVVSIQIQEHNYTSCNLIFEEDKLHEERGNLIAHILMQWTGRFDYKLQINWLQFKTSRKSHRTIHEYIEYILNQQQKKIKDLTRGGD